MRLQKVQEALNTKKIPFEYTEEDGCGSIDWEHRGLMYHVWELPESVSYTHLTLPTKLEV